MTLAQLQTKFEAYLLTEKRVAKIMDCAKTLQKSLQIDDIRVYLDDKG